MPDIKPCKCGNEAELFLVGGMEITQGYKWKCLKCGLDTKLYKTVQESIDAWNTRAEGEK